MSSVVRTKTAAGDVPSGRSFFETEVTSSRIRSSTLMRVRSAVDCASAVPPEQATMAARAMACSFEKAWRGTAGRYRSKSDMANEQARTAPALG